MSEHTDERRGTAAGQVDRPVRCGGRELTVALAKALGLPKYTVRAVLTLDATEPPRMELTMYATDAKGCPIVEAVTGEYGEGVERRLATVQFMVRLERFPDVSA